jgi:hypothetical protein
MRDISRNVCVVEMVTADFIPDSFALLDAG